MLFNGGKEFPASSSAFLHRQALPQIGITSRFIRLPVSVNVRPPGSRLGRRIHHSQVFTSRYFSYNGLMCDAPNEPEDKDRLISLPEAAEGCRFVYRPCFTRP